MTTSTLTVTGFVSARVAEDESFALSAQAAASIYDGGTVRWHWLRTNGTSSRWEPTLTDPMRVLAQCAAMRKIVELHTPIDEAPDGWCTLCDGDGWPCLTMRALASIWPDHPDFDLAWS